MQRFALGRSRRGRPPHPGALIQRLEAEGFPNLAADLAPLLQALHAVMLDTPESDPDFDQIRNARYEPIDEDVKELSHMNETTTSIPENAVLVAD